MTAAEQAPQVRLVLAAVFLVFLAQMALNPIIAPLSREVGLAEWQIGATVSAGAFMMVLTSQMWGRRSQSLGRKPVLVAAFILAFIATTLFALMAGLGMSGIVTGTALFLSFALLRGLLFGTAIAAVPPTAQAYIADVTTDQVSRVRGMAGIGAVQGMAMVGGAVLGGMLSGLGLMAPLVTVPVLLIVGLLLVSLRLRPESRTQLIARPVRVSPLDRRIWPFLLAGFGMFTALGFIMVITGFIVQDRLGLTAEQTGMLTGAALLVTGLGMVTGQSLVVPRSGWGPPMLLRVGSVIGLAGYSLLIPDAGLPLLLLAMFAIGLGLGLGIGLPGYTAGPSLLVSREEQGGMAGLIGATNGLTFVVAPTAGTALYGAMPQLPVMVGASIMLLVAVFVFTHPRLRRPPARRRRKL